MTEDLSMESRRLRSFKVFEWPKRKVVQPIILAEAGFFYFGCEDLVQCAFCRGTLDDWHEGDIPWVEHCKFYPRCPFVRGKWTGNVPLFDKKKEDFLLGASWSSLVDTVRSTQSPPPVFLNIEGVVMGAALESKSQQSQKQSGQAQHSSRGCSATLPHRRKRPQSERMLKRKELEKQKHSSKVGDQSVRSSYVESPAFPELASTETRLKTFTPKRGWPEHVTKVNTQLLADAGFFCSGTGGDAVACFFCGGVLARWLPTDDPFFQHAIWFPRCPFVRAVKGYEYIDACKLASWTGTSCSRVDDPLFCASAAPVRRQQAELDGGNPTLSVLSAKGDRVYNYHGARCTKVTIL